MKLKVPPVLVFAFFALLMYVLAKFLPVGSFDFFGRLYLMYFFIGVAFFVGTMALLQFRNSNTTVNPVTPSSASKLVTSGLYQYSRNPMYLAILLGLLALMLYFANVFNLLLAAGFVKYMNKFQIMPEEEALLKLFGKEYTQYCTLVRRWF
jgi:protein-S-isoprenylcysteine O-methyltransferase Ste14